MHRSFLTTVFNLLFDGYFYVYVRWNHFGLEPSLIISGWPQEIYIFSKYRYRLCTFKFSMIWFSFPETVAVSSYRKSERCSHGRE